MATNWGLRNTAMLGIGVDVLVLHTCSKPFDTMNVLDCMPRPNKFCDEYISWHDLSVNERSRYSAY